MVLLRLSALAEDDIAEILQESEIEFGADARLRYEALISAALRDIAEDPRRLGTRTRSELGRGIRSYHLSWSRKRAKGPFGQVARPRHFLLYRIAGPPVVHVGRVLHDAMETARHLPPNFSAPLD